ncbi:MAG TPA: glycosyltransferase family 87 protein [Chloroflexota bacterium]|nr:glycosyltransferase family 87 protein [Chloroflexota bacterium]
MPSERLAESEPVGGVHVIGRLIRARAPGIRLLRAALLAVAIVVGLFLGGAATTTLRAPGVYDKDLLQDYVMARAIEDGTDPYLPIQTLAERYLGRLPEAPRPTPSPHPPFAGFLLVPLTVVDYPTAAAIWMVLEAACLAASVQLLARAAGARLAPAQTICIAILLLAWYPVFSDLENGQFMVVLLLLLTGAWLAFRAERHALAGVLLGLTVLIKPITWPVLLAFLVRKNWRVVGPSAATLLIGYLVAGLVIGFDRIIVYVTRVLPAVSTLYGATSLNLSLWAVGTRFFTGTELLSDNGVNQSVVRISPLVSAPLAAQIVSIGVPLALLLVACLLVRTHLGDDWTLGVMTCVSILVTPISWGHYLVLAAIPATLVIQWLVAHRFPVAATNAALAVALLLVCPDFVWAHLVFFGSGAAAASPVSFARGLFLLEPTVAIAGLGWLAWTLGRRELPHPLAPSPSNGEGERSGHGRLPSPPRGEGQGVR